MKITREQIRKIIMEAVYVDPKGIATDSRNFDDYMQDAASKYKGPKPAPIKSMMTSNRPEDIRQGGMMASMFDDSEDFEGISQRVADDMDSYRKHNIESAPSRKDPYLDANPQVKVWMDSIRPKIEVAAREEILNNLKEYIEDFSNAEKHDLNWIEIEMLDLIADNIADSGSSVGKLIKLARKHRLGSSVNLNIQNAVYDLEAEFLTPLQRAIKNAS